MKDITLRFVLRENLNGSWRLVLDSDATEVHVCDLAVFDAVHAHYEVAELLGGALQKMAMERAERKQE